MIYIWSQTLKFDFSFFVLGEYSIEIKLVKVYNDTIYNTVKKEIIVNYREYLKTSNMAKVTLGLLAVILALSIYLVSQVLKYLGTTSAIMGLVGAIVLAALIWLCHRKKPVAALVIEIVLIVGLVVAMVFIGKVNSIVDEVSETVEYEIVQIVAPVDSSIEATDNFEGYVLGYVNSDDGAYEKSSEILVENQKEVLRSRPYESTEQLYGDLMAYSTELMVLTSTTRSDLSVIDEEYEDKLKVIFEAKYEVEAAKAKAVDISKEPFVLYLCGADLSSGEDISSTGRGDVNILLTVNPNTEQVYLQVVPRDTFVYIPCRGGSSKLSYSGWWGGVQSSIDSIEDKFDIDINYYAKINFNGLIDLVDALGGVTVYSHYTYSYQGYSFVEGYNEIDGQKALRFARARKMLPQNELSRGQHQMELIKGIFKKFAQNPTYENSMAVLNSLSSNFVTNLPEEDYYDAFKLVVKLLPQLQEMENHSIQGTYQWHYDEVRDGHYQYYYYPAEGEIERVRNNINAVLEGNVIE